MRPLSLIFAAAALMICLCATPARVLAQEEQKAEQSDTAKQVIVNNYYYGVHPYWSYPVYPPLYGYHYPRSFVGFSVFVPFNRHVFGHRFPHLRGYGFGRHFGHFRSPGIRSGGGRMRY